MATKKNHYFWLKHPGEAPIVCTMLYCTYLDEHAGLVVAVRRERLGLLGGDRCVTLDQRGHHTARRLDTQGQRRHVEQQQVLHLLRLQTQNRTQTQSRTNNTHADTRNKPVV